MEVANQPAKPLRILCIDDEMRILRPASRGLLLIYPLDTSEIEGLEAATFVPAFALSFPATQRARRLQYKVTLKWIAQQMERFGQEDIDDDDSDE